MITDRPHVNKHLKNSSPRHQILVSLKPSSEKPYLEFARGTFLIILGVPSPSFSVINSMSQETSPLGTLTLP